MKTFSLLVALLLAAAAISAQSAQPTDAQGTIVSQGVSQPVSVPQTQPVPGSTGSGKGDVGQPVNTTPVGTTPQPVSAQPSTGTGRDGGVKPLNTTKVTPPRTKPVVQPVPTPDTKPVAQPTKGNGHHGRKKGKHAGGAKHAGGEKHAGGDKHAGGGKHAGGREHEKENKR